MKLWKLAAGVLFGLVVVVVMSYAGSMIGGNGTYDRSIMASWLQAVGAFVAIAGGFAGVLYQTRNTDEQRAREIKQRAKELFTLIAVIANDAILEVDRLSELLSPENFENVAYDDLCRNRMTAQVRRTVSNLGAIDSTLSGLLSASNLQSEHIRLLLKLRRQIGKAVIHLVGIDDPYSQISAAEVDFEPLAYEMKQIRFFAGSNSVHVELA
ncbi:hypothetical protein [Burkholderia contaminans]|uniref:Uncharacterized protein n=1 Tax=Burkholderia contaminans TaxID=488447 RepID=A0A6P3BJL3_9BURK|nr:hypothetical protein [Burkholderia contaminans]VWD55886.1 hypothetical protein BCO71033_05866 [Burkholderia contaminans]